MVTPKPAKGSSSSKPSARQRRAERMVASGEHASVREALSAIYRGEFAARNAKAKGEHFKNYSAKERERRSLKSLLDAGEWHDAIELIKEFTDDDPDTEEALWAIFRKSYQPTKG